MEKVQGWRASQALQKEGVGYIMESGWEQQELPDWSLIRYVTDPRMKQRICVWLAYTKELTAEQQRVLEKIANILDVHFSPYVGQSPDALSEWSEAM